MQLQQMRGHLKLKGLFKAIVHVQRESSGAMFFSIPWYSA